MDLRDAFHRNDIVTFSAILKSDTVDINRGIEYQGRRIDNGNLITCTYSTRIVSEIFHSTHHTGRMNFLKLLLENGKLRINDVIYWYDTILEMACDKNEMEIIELCLKRDDLIFRQYEIMAILIKCNYTNLLKYFIEKGKININLQNKHGASPLTYALDYGNNEIAEILLLNGAVFSTHSKGFTCGYSNNDGNEYPIHKHKTLSKFPQNLIISTS